MSSSNTSAAVIFKQRLRQQELLIGTWIKTPSHIVAEVLAGTELDVLCLDAEHAPFDRVTLDTSILACRANSKAVLVRVPSNDPAQVLNALDLGSSGVIIPHVMTRTSAQTSAASALYGPGGRGYAGSSRAALYTRKPMSQHIADSNAATSIIAQIEDREGVRYVEAIASVPEVDCLFIGRADLAVSLGVNNPASSEVIVAAQHVCEAARAAGKVVGMFLTDPGEIPGWRALGVSLFLLESDHVFMLKGAAALKRLV
jgi:2-keto-3-deoxy-L-rhamnonate aldolase RhmA